MKDIAKALVYTGIFAVPFIVLIISNSLFFPFITGKNFTFRIIVEVIFASWIILALYEPVYRPKFSWIAGSFAALLGIMFFANILGESPMTSFWSNFERMEGYVTLVHTFMFLVVAGSVLINDKLWNRFFNTTLLAGVILAMYAFAQLAGNITINQGGWRLDGTLGNSAYMAIYTLFHVFIALLMIVRTKSTGLRYVYIALALLFGYLLIQTATRGTILGLVGGLGVTTLYIALFTKNHPNVRKLAAGSLLALVVLVGLFINFRHSTFIQQNPYLGRVANITLSEGDVRFKVWAMAYEGFKERPMLGWGQSNFNYLFNKYYDPSIYYAEAWYDRVHNIAFDWLIAGGILGFLAYFGILAAAIFYLFVRPLVKHEEAFTVAERGVLLGLLAGYTFHNLFVFDNIVSYIFYAAILAFIHARIAMPCEKVQKRNVDHRIIEQVWSPVIVIALVAIVYTVNVPGIHAAKDIIVAFQAQTPEETLKAFNQALDRGSFGDQEIREQMTRRVLDVVNAQNSGITEEVKQEMRARVEEELIKQKEEKPGDARVHVFLSSFYRMIGNPDRAIEELLVARELSPKKQQIIFEQGFAHIMKQDYEGALTLFKEAYELAPSYEEARVFYAAAALYTGKRDLVDELIPDKALPTFVSSDYVVQAAYTTKQYDILIDIFKKRIETNPSDPQIRANLAYLLNEAGDTPGAVEVLKKAAVDIPSFKAQAEEFMTSLVRTNLGIAETKEPEVKPTVEKGVQ